jgi:hypothetical protein
MAHGAPGDKYCIGLDGHGEIHEHDRNEINDAIGLCSFY